MVLGELTLGQAMKRYRESKKWNKSQMARFLGTSRHNYGTIESGKNKNPRLKTFFAFLREATTIETISECPQKQDHYHVVYELTAGEVERG